MFKEDQINNGDNMITESVKCGRCNQWFKREILEDKKIEKDGKVEEYLCPDCDTEIQEEDSE